MNLRNRRHRVVALCFIIRTQNSDHSLHETSVFVFLRERSFINLNLSTSLFISINCSIKCCDFLDDFKFLRLLGRRASDKFVRIIWPQQRCHINLAKPRHRNGLRLASWPHERPMPHATCRREGRTCHFVISIDSLS